MPLQNSLKDGISLLYTLSSGRMNEITIKSSKQSNNRNTTTDRSSLIENGNEEIFRNALSLTAPEESLVPITGDPNEFSRLGIQLSYIPFLIREIQRKTDIVDMENAVTSDICEKFIKPMTAPYQSSFCEYLLCTEPSRVGVGKVFISHAWKQKFLEVVEALQRYFVDCPDIMIWFDLFSNNQHKAPGRNFHWWSNTFKIAISEFGQTVMVFAPWNDPIPLTRAWCIWELYCTIETNCRFGIATSSIGEEQFIKNIENGTENAVNSMLATIDCVNSNCFIPHDKNQIHEAIQRTVGFSTLNARIFEVMRQWIIEKYGQHYQIRAFQLGSDDIDTLKTRFYLSLLYLHQGKYDIAESHLLGCLDRVRNFTSIFEYQSLSFNILTFLAAYTRNRVNWIKRKNLLWNALKNGNSCLVQNTTILWSLKTISPQSTPTSANTVKPNLYFLISIASPRKSMVLPIYKHYSTWEI
jgi:hypothetical protein